MKYVIKLTKTLERTVIVNANSDEEADKKLNNNEIEREWIRNTNQNPSYGEWNYEFGDHYSVDDDELITCADDIAKLYGCENETQLERALFKYTNCGMCASWNKDYIDLVGYVEGCDAEFPHSIMYFPFTVSEFRRVRDILEEEADQLWHEWNDDEE